MVISPRVRQRRCAAAKSECSNQLHHNLRLVTNYVAVGELKPPQRALRKHGKRQISALKASISEFGIVKPILVDADCKIVAGYGVWLAVKANRGELRAGPAPAAQT